MNRYLFLTFRMITISERTRRIYIMEKKIETLIKQIIFGHGDKIQQHY